VKNWEIGIPEIRLEVFPGLPGVELPWWVKTVPPAGLVIKKVNRTRSVD